MKAGVAHIAGQFYVSRALLIKHGVPENTVNAWRTSARIERATVPGAGLHFRYDTLPESARAALPFASLEAVEWAAHEARAQQAAEAARLQGWGTYAALRQAVEAGWPAHAQAFLAVFGHGPDGQAEAGRYARLQAALDWCLNGHHGYTKQQLLPAFRALGLPYCPKEGGTGAYASFTRKLKEYGAAPDKVAALVNKHKLTPNDNARKVKAAQVAWLVRYYSRADKPTVAETWEQYNLAAAGQGWPQLDTPGTVGTVLNEHKPAWQAARHGLAAAKSELGYRVSKQRPSVPDLLLEFDGTNDPLAFTDDTGREVTDLYVVRVWDMHSDCIVGSAYGFTETADLVLAALQDYLLRQRRVPQQFRFDRGAANMSQAVQELLTQTGAAFFPSQAKRPTGRRSEQLTGLFQKTVLRKLPWFRGANITSQRDQDLRPNPDRLSAALKERTTVAAVIAACRQAEQEWNERQPGPRVQQQQPPLHRYLAGQAERPALALGSLAALLFQQRARPVRYTAYGLQIEVNGQTYAYEPQLASGYPDLAAHRAANGHQYEVWERRDGNREMVLVRRADGRGGWQELQAKFAFAEALADRQPGETARLHSILTADAHGLQADLAAALTERDAGRVDMGLRLGKDAWNEANARAEVTLAVPDRKRPASAGSLWHLTHLHAPPPASPPSLEPVD